MQKLLKIVEMNKKVMLVIIAVLCFFIGAILLDEIPAIKALVALFELGAGGILGYFWKKYEDVKFFDVYESKVENLSKINDKLIQENDSLTKKVAKLSKSVQTKENGQKKSRKK